MIITYNKVIWNRYRSLNLDIKRTNRILKIIYYSFQYPQTQASWQNVRTQRTYAKCQTRNSCSLCWSRLSSSSSQTRSGFFQSWPRQKYPCSNRQDEFHRRTIIDKLACSYEEISVKETSVNKRKIFYTRVLKINNGLRLEDKPSRYWSPYR